MARKDRGSKEKKGFFSLGNKSTPPPPPPSAISTDPSVEAEIAALKAEIEAYYLEHPGQDPTMPDKVFVKNISELEDKLTGHLPKHEEHVPQIFAIEPAQSAVTATSTATEQRTKGYFEPKVTAPAPQINQFFFQGTSGAEVAQTITKNTGMTIESEPIFIPETEPEDKDFSGLFSAIGSETQQQLDMAAASAKAVLQSGSKPIDLSESANAQPAGVRSVSPALQEQLQKDLEQAWYEDETKPASKVTSLFSSEETTDAPTQGEELSLNIEEDGYLDIGDLLQSETNTSNSALEDEDFDAKAPYMETLDEDSESKAEDFWDSSLDESSSLSDSQESLQETAASEDWAKAQFPFLSTAFAAEDEENNQEILEPFTAGSEPVAKEVELQADSQPLATDFSTIMEEEDGAQSYEDSMAMLRNLLQEDEPVAFSETSPNVVSSPVFSDTYSYSLDTESSCAPISSDILTFGGNVEAEVESDKSQYFEQHDSLTQEDSERNLAPNISAATGEERLYSLLSALEQPSDFGQEQEAYTQESDQDLVPNSAEFEPINFEADQGFASVASAACDETTFSSENYDTPLDYSAITEFEVESVGMAVQPEEEMIAAWEGVYQAQVEECVSPSVSTLEEGAVEPQPTEEQKNFNDSRNDISAEADSVTYHEAEYVTTSPTEEQLHYDQIEADTSTQADDTRSSEDFSDMEEEDLEEHQSEEELLIMKLCQEVSAVNSDGSINYDVLPVEELQDEVETWNGENPEAFFQELVQARVQETQPIIKEAIYKHPNQLEGVEILEPSNTAENPSLFVQQNNSTAQSPDANSGAAQSSPESPFMAQLKKQIPESGESGRPTEEALADIAAALEESSSEEDNSTSAHDVIDEGEAQTRAFTERNRAVFQGDFQDSSTDKEENGHRNSAQDYDPDEDDFDQPKKRRQVVKRQAAPPISPTQIYEKKKRESFWKRIWQKLFGNRKEKSAEADCDKIDEMKPQPKVRREVEDVGPIEELPNLNNQEVFINGIVSGEVAGEIVTINSYAVVKSDVVAYKQCTVLPLASVIGEIRAESVIVKGIVRGNIRASKSVLVKDDSLVIGDIHCPLIGVEQRALVEGSLFYDNE